VTQDPIEFFGGDVNLYVYVANNPMSSSDPLGLRILRGFASYYNLPGNETASGALFNPNAMAAAMTAVPLGSRVTVEYCSPEGQLVSIQVVVNDRGPFRTGPSGRAVRPLSPNPYRVIDLTPAAFKQLTGNLGLGVVPVTVITPDDPFEPSGPPDQTCKPKPKSSR